MTKDGGGTTSKSALTASHDYLVRGNCPRYNAQRTSYSETVSVYLILLRCNYLDEFSRRG